MPACLVEDHDGMLVRSDGFGELVEELLHRLCIGIGHDQGEAVIRAGLHGGEDIGAR